MNNGTTRNIANRYIPFTIYQNTLSYLDILKSLSLSKLIFFNLRY